jgi:peptidoglycan/LPS O-acetylase OafA/YrhL
MPEIDPVAVLVATAAAFLAGGAYYAVLGNQLTGASERMPPWKLAVELLRCLLLAAVVAGLAEQGGIDAWTGGLLLGLALWIGFPLVLWTGAIIHENTPPKQAAIHAGDWLAKLLLVAVIVT